LLAALKTLEVAKYKTYNDVDRALEEAIRETRVRQFVTKNRTLGENEKFQWRIGLDEIIANYDALTEALCANRSFATRACFIRGGRSHFITDNGIPRIRALFPKAGIVTFVDAGHWIHIDAADRFYQAVTGFLLRDSQ